MVMLMALKTYFERQSLRWQKAEQGIAKESVDVKGKT